MKHLPKIIILLMALIPLAPPFFVEGGVFDAIEIVNGEIVHGKHLDNAVTVVKYMFLTVFSLFFPYLVKYKVPQFYIFLSTLLSMWFFSMLVFELYNFDMSYFQTVNLQSKELFNKFVITFIFGLLIFRTYEQWKGKNL